MVRHRIVVSRAFLVTLALLLVVGSPMLQPPLVIDTVMDIGAFSLVLIGAFGRLWALSYIGSRKKKSLITQGPYSVTRNPLYLFSLIGALGVGIVTDSVLVVCLITAMFAIYYPVVIRAEERSLLRIHGEAFDSYRRQVSTFIPRISSYFEPEGYTVNARAFRRALLSVMWFPMAYALLLFVEKLREAGVIPVLFKIP